MIVKVAIIDQFGKPVIGLKYEDFIFSDTDIIDVKEIKPGLYLPIKTKYNQIEKYIELIKL